MTLYETIFARRSVRKYDGATLDAAALDEIKAYADSAKQLAEQSARFEIVAADKLKGGLAPYALLAFADDSDAAFVNIGYTLQGVDLCLQSRGFGSLWQGMASPKDKPADFKILLGFGKTGEPLRSGEGDFKRKKLSDIANADNAVTRAARLAPSGVNFQPWKLYFSDGSVTVRADVRGIGKIIPGRMYLFDLGIITKHVEVALEHEGKTVTAIEVSGSGKNSAVEVQYE
jgi:nitroreductase